MPSSSIPTSTPTCTLNSWSIIEKCDSHEEFKHSFISKNNEVNSLCYCEFITDSDVEFYLALNTTSESCIDSVIDLAKANNNQEFTCNF